MEKNKYWVYIVFMVAIVMLNSESRGREREEKILELIGGKRTEGANFLLVVAC